VSEVSESPHKHAWSLALRNAGHMIDYVAEMEPGLSDNFVLEQANQRGALLLTADKEFWRISVSSETALFRRYPGEAGRIITVEKG
jgi:hypothetical protein